MQWGAGGICQGARIGLAAAPRERSEATTWGVDSGASDANSRLDQPSASQGVSPSRPPSVALPAGALLPFCRSEAASSGHGRVAELVEIDVAADTVSPEPASTSLLSPSALQNCYCQFTKSGGSV